MITIIGFINRVDNWRYIGHKKLCFCMVSLTLNSCLACAYHAKTASGSSSFFSGLCLSCKNKAFDSPQTKHGHWMRKVDLFLLWEHRLSKPYQETTLHVIFSIPQFWILRGPAPKKRPMIFGWKIKSADFHLLSRGYQILFRNDFLLFQFRFKPKLLTLEFLSSDGNQIRVK